MRTSRLWVLGATACSLQAGGPAVLAPTDASVRLDGAVIDAGTRADATVDSGQVDASVGACDPNKPFGPAVSVNELDMVGQNQSLRLFDGALQAAFGSTRPGGAGGYDVFLTSRSSLSSPFAPPFSGTLLNSATDDVDPTLPNDGLIIYFASKRAGVLQLYQSKRPTTVDAFGIPALVANVGAFPANDFHPFVTPDGAHLYFASDRASTRDIYRADLGSNTFFGAPSKIGELSSGKSNSESPVLSADGLTVYFASDRTDPQAKGGYDVWKAKRSTIGGTFDTPVPVPELSTASADLPTHLTSDGCTMVLTSDRAGGQNEVFTATRPL